MDEGARSASKGRKLSMSASNQKYNELVAKKIRTQHKILNMKKQ